MRNGIEVCESEKRSRWSDCDINLGDINGDGSVNALDIEPFLDLLFGP